MPRRPPSAAVRRRRLAVALGALAAFVAGTVLGGGHGDDHGAAKPAAGRPGAVPGPAARRAARAAVDGLSLEQQVGRLVVLRFAGSAVPEYVTRNLRAGRVAGVIVFRDNAASRPAMARIGAALRAAGRAGGMTPIVCADQEGGDIRVLPWAPPSAGQATQAAAGTEGADARAAAAALRASGVNVALAPVADVPASPGSAVAGRGFSSDPARAAAAVDAAVRGWRAGGVAATAKHFPGLGNATVNTDDGPATVGGGAPTEADLRPFRAAIAAGVPLVMASHARYPALDAERIASQSPAIVDGLLRRRLGFRGVVVTDSIEAAAVTATGTLEQAALRSIGAGDDLVLTTGRGSYIRVYRALLAEARRSSAFRARVRTSAGRVMALQRTLR